MSVLSFFGGKSARNGNSAPPTPAPAAPEPEDNSAISKETGIVLDALGGLLQTYGKYAFDTDFRNGDDIRRLVHGWMLHATMGSPRPDHPADRPSAGVFYRDWKGLSQFVGETRRDESKYVTRALDDMRSVVWAFVAAIHQVVVEEHEESRIAGDHLGRMRVAVDSNSTDLIKREALAVVSVMEQLMAHRKERQRQQFAVLADKLKNLGRELEDARRESALDPLTGLANRKAFDEYISRSIELHSLLGQPASLMMIDVDNFKGINDQFGHPAGDTALRQVANVLSKTFLRRVDFVCRYGGDEFAVILQETAIGNAQLLAERLRRQVQELRPIELPPPPAGEPVDPDAPAAPQLTLSIGVAELAVGDDATAWVKRADGALYQSKRAGRDTVSAAPGATGVAAPAVAR
ncbi:MAG: GGDEF domain-containing protein [Gemmatimonadetes bacterium]|nr:GGDEF domain-containing protein [Gemmatimonadota bacterium]MBK6458493.1 GGDEF domain-containing protein [Gemmatimonadota bacterium]MBK6843465.1 GGDEF domain-containing protein [Gemmatimonadota bacterium]MBK8646368.1 GGDEF domain-containing protein [Gemmatimonadota bacterium]MBP9106067.1 GGDEF domain-containing protein [Gemmatimonadaceae bacterium]